ncbi:MAG TPA: branched-chain amino acid ABC transporter permease [Acetobacteraceae bacterium]|jgi:branched-chain amino acid transport system permease protein|nr:branched-chain amino acid ABC transporter permease [Acetobacteraceae bacterium]
MDTTVFLQLLLPGLTTGCVYALVALGFVLCANVSGVVNFAQGEFVMLGGMAAAWLIGLNVPFVLAIVAATAIGGAVGAAQEFLTLAPVRQQPHFIQITTTVGFAVVLRGITLIVAGKDALSVPGFSGDGVFFVFGAILPVQSLWVWGATLLMLVGTFTVLRYTTIGRAVRACSINLQAARLMGVNAERLRVIVFAVSGATGALAGVVITPIVLASWDAGLTYSTKGFIGAILGGFRSPMAAVLGGLFIGLLESLGAGYVSSGWKDFIVYGVLLAWLLIQGGVFLRGRAGAAAGGQ